MSRVASVVLSGVGFLTDAYDLFNINLVLKVMKEVYPDPDSTAVSLIASLALWGGLVGQLVFGFFADLVGRRVAFVVTSLLITVAALGCSLSFAIGPVSIYLVLAAWRCLLGLGVGGDYPLSAAVTIESSSLLTRGRRIAAIFFMQGLGATLATAVVVTLIFNDVPYEVVWRVAVGFGAVPGALGAYFRWQMHETREYQKVARAHTQISLSAMRPHWRALMGTAVAWFLVDITFYANGLFSAEITTLMGLSHTIREEALNAFYISLIALPGYAVTILTIDVLGRKTIQLTGFFMMGVLYVLLFALFDTLKPHKALFLFLYALTYFFANFGPNATTYIIPAEVFPTNVRATCHGISAACGKLGAAIASYAFDPIKDWVDIEFVFLLCGIVSFAGFAWTIFFIPQYSQKRLYRPSQLESRPLSGATSDDDDSLIESHSLTSLSRASHSQPM